MGWVITVIQMIFGLSIACPLEIMSCSNAFSTPLEIVPEWYSPTVFNLLRIVTSKGIGDLSPNYYFLVHYREC